MSFLAYWFLRIKWFFAKSVKITIQKNINKENNLHPEIRILHLGVLTTQTFFNIALVVLKIFKVNLPPSPRHLAQIKSDVKNVKGKNSHVHPRRFCNWPSPSEISWGILSFWYLSENVLLSRSFLSWLS